MQDNGFLLFYFDENVFFPHYVCRQKKKKRKTKAFLKTRLDKAIFWGLLLEDREKGNRDVGQLEKEKHGKIETPMEKE